MSASFAARLLKLGSLKYRKSWAQDLRKKLGLCQWKLQEAPRYHVSYVIHLIICYNGWLKWSLPANGCPQWMTQQFRDRRCCPQQICLDRIWREEGPCRRSRATLRGATGNLDHWGDIGHEPALEKKNAHDDQSSHPVVQTPATSWASWNPGSQGPWINLEWNIEPQNSQQSQGWKLMFQTHSWGFNQVPVQVFEGIFFYIICSSSPHQLHRDSWIPCPVLRTEIKISSFRDRLPFCPEVRWSHAA